MLTLVLRSPALSVESLAGEATVSIAVSAMADDVASCCDVGATLVSYISGIGLEIPGLLPVGLIASTLVESSYLISVPARCIPLLPSWSVFVVCDANALRATSLLPTLSTPCLASFFLARSSITFLLMATAALMSTILSCER